MTFIGKVSNGTVLLPPDAHLSEGGGGGSASGRGEA